MLTLIVWFNGGPGCSSLIGMMTGNGPLKFEFNSTDVAENPNSWTKLGNVLYVDQPAGTGFSTASDPYPVHDMARVTSDFVKWLHVFYAHFPHMQNKQLHMIGESWAGLYIPYFADAMLENSDCLPLNLRSISLGDGAWGNAAAMTSVTIGSFLHAKQSELSIPEDILEVFDEAGEICGFDEVLEAASEYPPDGKIMIPGNPEGLDYKRSLLKRDDIGIGDVLGQDCAPHPVTAEETRKSILNSTCHGPCATFSTAVDYMFTSSQIGTGPPCFDMYDISNNCSAVDEQALIAAYFSRADVQDALHIPPPPANSSSSAVQFLPCSSEIMQTLLAQSPPPEPPAYSIIPDLTSFHNVHLHIYSGEHDMLINHFGAELSMQNLTWRGTRGWAHPPDNVFYVDNAAPDNKPPCTPTSHLKSQPCVPEGEEMPPEAGLWGEGRKATYHLFYDAGHSVFVKQPGPMFAYVRDVVVSNL